MCYEEKETHKGREGGDLKGKGDIRKRKGWTMIICRLCGRFSPRSHKSHKKRIGPVEEII